MQVFIEIEEPTYSYQQQNSGNLEWQFLLKEYVSYGVQKVDPTIREKQ